LRRRAGIRNPERGRAPGRGARRGDSRSVGTRLAGCDERMRPRRGVGYRGRTDRSALLEDLSRDGGGTRHEPRRCRVLREVPVWMKASPGVPPPLAAFPPGPRRRCRGRRRQECAPTPHQLPVLGERGQLPVHRHDAIVRTRGFSRTQDCFSSRSRSPDRVPEGVDRSRPGVPWRSQARMALPVDERALETRLHLSRAMAFESTAGSDCRAGTQKPGQPRSSSTRGVVPRGGS